MGNLEQSASPPPSGVAAYDLVNAIYGNTLYGTWVDYGTPDYNTVYVEQSADGSTDWTNYTSQDVYTYAEVVIYSLPENYYYRFYVVVHYGGSDYTSANSSAEYVFPM